MNESLSQRVKKIGDELNALKASSAYNVSGLSRTLTTTGSWSGNITPPSGVGFRNVCLRVRFTPNSVINYTPIASLGFKATVSPTTVDIMEQDNIPDPVWAIPSDRGVYDEQMSYVSVDQATSSYIEWLFFFTNPFAYNHSRTLTVQFQVVSMLSGQLTIGVVR